MKLNEYNEKHNAGTLSDAEWEKLAQSMLVAKFDQEITEKWSKSLQEQGIYREQPAAKLVSIGSIRKWMAAASVLLIVVAAGWYIFFHNTMSPAQQMATNYLETPFRLNQGNTRGEESIEKNRGKAYEAFESQQYEKSLHYLQIVEATGQAKATDYFQMGLCMMYMPHHDYPGAIRAFKASQKSDPGAYKDEINWFSGLCYLMLNDNTNATASLQKVIESSSSRNRDAASDLVRKIQNR